MIVTTNVHIETQLSEHKTLYRLSLHACLRLQNRAEFPAKVQRGKF